MKTKICKRILIQIASLIIMCVCLCLGKGHAVYAAAACQLWVGDPTDSAYVKDFIRETDNNIEHYLFLMNTYDISDLDINFSGEIDSVSAGVIDTEDSEITGVDFSAIEYLQLNFSDSHVEYVYVMKSDLPCMMLQLNGTDLATVHNDKTIKYSGNQLTISDVNNPSYNLSGVVEFKGRGNSSWIWYDKKSYQIKFDSKTAVLGMAKAKKWVLLANAGDPSLMCNMLAFNLADTYEMTYAPDARYVDLWVDGEYIGNYLICEKVEIGSNRLNLQDDLGVLVELDDACYFEEEYWIQSSVTGYHYVFKEFKNEDKIDEAIAEFESFITGVESNLYSGDVDEEALFNDVDVESLAQYYLLNEYLLNHESLGVTSIYLYRDGKDDKLHFGPVWDFDTSMSNSGYYPDGSFCVNFEQKLIPHFITVPGVSQYIIQCWDSKYHSLTGTLETNANSLATQLAASAEMNYTRWRWLGTDHVKGHYQDTYAECVQVLKEWIASRKNYFVPIKSYIELSVSDEEGEITVTTYSQIDSVDLWIWQNDDRSDLKFVHPEKLDSTHWRYRFPLSYFRNGVLNIHADEEHGSQKYRIGSNEIYLERGILHLHEIAGTDLMYRVLDSGELGNISLWIWSEDNLSDLTRIVGSRNLDGDWEIRIPVNGIKKDVTYNVHAVTEMVGEETVFTDTFVIESANAAFYLEEDSLKFVYDTDPVTYANLGVWMWKNPDYSDLKYYDLENTEDSKWSVTVSREAFDPDTDYNVCAVYYEDDQETVIGTFVLKTPYWENVQPTDDEDDEIESFLLYRLYNPNSGEHFWTGSVEERENLVSEGWDFEGNGWYSPKYTGAPVYRLYNENTGDHQYTMSEEEKENLINGGWRYEGVAWNSASPEKGSPLFRMFNPNAEANGEPGTHFFTMSEEEKDMLVNEGWIYEGIGWYAV